ncbi:MAG: carboxy terminal-processing peptidase [Lentisphaeria bacterium]|nr:carboxy terminal-processing peptidase [Lentisphaeria bacterium]
MYRRIRASFPVSLLLTGLTVLFFTFNCCGAAPDENAFSDEQLSAITLKTLQTLHKNHYRQIELTSKLAVAHLEAYIKALDGNNDFFTEKDIKLFKRPPEEHFSALLKGDNTKAFQIYGRFLARHAEYRAFAEKLLKTKIDFTVDEEFTPDRSKLPRCKDDAELHALWHKRIKNEVLFYRLFDRAMAESKDPEDRKALEDAKRWNAGTPESKVLKRLRDVSNAVQKRSKIDILGIYLNALAHVYGPHSNYMAPRTAKNFDIDMSLSLTGIGATLTTDNGFIKIVALVPGGPAARDGRLKINDRIVAVTQENGATVDVIDMPVDEAVQYIRGKENTKVTLTVLPGAKGRSGVPVRITLTRAKIQLVDSEASGRIINCNGKKVGVINLPGFYMDFEGAMRGDPNFKRCSEDVRKLLVKFRKEGVHSVVMDLRRNGGGSLAEAINLTGLFIPTGPVVQRRDFRRRIALAVDDDPAVEWKGPVIVMISKFSASAAEIFSAALRDCDRAVVVGDSRSFGKGTVLQVEKLKEGYNFFTSRSRNIGSVTFEIEMFYRITGSSVQQLGIRSDIRIPSLTEEMKAGEMFLDNHLPWDSIDPVSRSSYISDIDDKIAVLKKRSAARIAASPEFKAINRRLLMFREHRKKKSVSLNEARRWKDYQQEKTIADAEEKELGLKDENKKEKLDAAAKEAAAIAADLYDLLQGK